MKESDIHQPVWSIDCNTQTVNGEQQTLTSPNKHKAATNSVTERPTVQKGWMTDWNPWLMPWLHIFKETYLHKKKTD